MTGLRRLALRGRERIRILREFMIDAWRYSRDAMPPEGSMTADWAPAHIAAQLTKDYHRVEKGLALRSPKRPFGDAVAARMRTGIAAGKISAELENNAQTALIALERWNGAGVIAEDVAPLAPSLDVVEHDLFARRRSVRDFDETPVDNALIERVVSKAINTPSVCNRQPWHVTVLTGPKRSRALMLQNGNRGFGEIPVVAVISVDARYFGGAGERNQIWIDGGLFAMTFVWAAESEGLASCMLNWSVSNGRSDSLRRELGLRRSDQIICLVALGYPRAGARIARSPRREVAQVLSVDDS